MSVDCLSAIGIFTVIAFFEILGVLITQDIFKDEMVTLNLATIINVFAIAILVMFNLGIIHK